MAARPAPRDPLRKRREEPLLAKRDPGAGVAAGRRCRAAPRPARLRSKIRRRAAGISKTESEPRLALVPFLPPSPNRRGAATALPKPIHSDHPKKVFGTEPREQSSNPALSEQQGKTAQGFPYVGRCESKPMISGLQGWPESEHTGPDGENPLVTGSKACGPAARSSSAAPDVSTPGKNDSWAQTAPIPTPVWRSDTSRGMRFALNKTCLLAPPKPPGTHRKSRLPRRLPSGGSGAIASLQRDLLGAVGQFAFLVYRSQATLT